MKFLNLLLLSAATVMAANPKATAAVAAKNCVKNKGVCNPTVNPPVNCCEGFACVTPENAGLGASGTCQVMQPSKTAGPKASKGTKPDKGSSAKPTKPAKSDSPKPTKPAKSEPPKPAKPSKGKPAKSEPTKPVKPTKGDPTKPVKPTKAQPTKPVKPTKPAKTEKGGKATGGSKKKAKATSA